MTRKVTLSAVQPPLLRRETLAEAQVAHLEAVSELLREAAGGGPIWRCCRSAST